MVPLGRHSVGTSQIHWNLHVNGRPLRPGTYEVSLHSIAASELSPDTPPGEVTLTVPATGKVRVVLNTCAGTVTNLGHDLTWATESCPGILANPLLGPLQSNGGPTQTMAPGATAAIDQIAYTPTSCPATDQRGELRPDNSEAACDVGAYERQDSRLVVCPTCFRVFSGLTPPPRFFDLRAGGTENRSATVVAVLRKPRELMLLVRKLERGRLELVGFVRLGHHPAGRSLTHWNLRVGGHLLARGRYQVVMYALDNRNELSLPANPGTRTLIVLADGKVRT